MALKIKLFFIILFFCLFPAPAPGQDMPFDYNNAKFNQAVKGYRKLADNGKLEGYLNQAVILKDLGYYRQAIQVLQPAISRFGYDLQVFSLLARLYYLDRKPDKAIRALKKIAAVKSQDVETTLLFALCYLDLGDGAEAQKYLERTLALDKNNLLAHLCLAEHYSRREKLSEAAEEYKKVNTIDASIQNIYQPWGSLLLKSGNLKEAFRIFEKLTTLEPKNELAKTKLAEARLLLGREFFQKERDKRIQTKTKKMVFVSPAQASPEMVSVRVGLIQADASIELKSSRAFEIKSKEALLGQGQAGENYLISKDANNNLVVSLPDKKNLVASESIVIRPQGNDATITLFDVKYGKGDYWSSWEDRSYRGEIEVQAIPKGISVVNKVSLEEYLYGVVPAEMPAYWPIEALKVQAVAARSEAMAKLGRHKEEGFDFCAEVHCQAYKGAESETTATNQAVDATRGKIMTYEGKAIDAIYSSNCGGYTQDNIFGDGIDVSYLKGNLDSLDGLGLTFPLSPLAMESWLKKPSPEILCNIADSGAPSSFRWLRIYSAEEMNILLSNIADFGAIKKIKVLKRQKSGHISAIKIIGTKSSLVMEKELNIRKALGNLRSSMFKVEIKHNTEGNPEEFIFYGGGWGHGVGMCQSGGCGLAKQGKPYTEIINHYYRGVLLKRIY